MNKRLSRAGLLLLIAWLGLLVLVMIRGTLALPYISDDFEHGQLIAQIRAGLTPANDLILLPFHGQDLVLLRLLFWFGTLAGGMSLTWVRLGVAAAHIAGAVGCAILCARWTGSRVAGWFAGTLYAGAVGFIGEQIWWPSSAIFCFGSVFLILAMAALIPGAKNRALSLGTSVLMLALAALGLNGILVAALALPLYCWLLMPPGAFWRRRAPMVLLGVICALAVIARLAAPSSGQIEISLRGLGLGAWLILTAPLRFFSSWTTFALPGFRMIWHWAPLVWLPLLASLWFINQHYRRVLIAVWTPAILLSMLVGMARADYPVRFGPGSFYATDRYYYIFLFPLVTHCVLFVSSLKWRPTAGALLVFLVAAALAGSRARYFANIPRANFEATGHALEQGRLLVQKIRSSTTRPLLLSDAAIPIDGARNNLMTLAFLIYSEYPRGIPGVRIVRQPRDAQGVAMENSLLKGWTRAASSRINFKDGSYEEDLIYGFSWWEPPFRWMGARGSLQLIAAPGDLVISSYAPVDQLRRTIHVSVTVNDRPIGSFAITKAGLHEYRLQPPDLRPGAIAKITLASDVVWHARDIFPDSLDDRDLSIAISAIGFYVRP